MFLPQSKATGLEHLSKQSKNTAYGKQNRLSHGRTARNSWKDGARSRLSQSVFGEGVAAKRLDHRSIYDQWIDLRRRPMRARQPMYWRAKGLSLTAVNWTCPSKSYWRWQQAIRLEDDPRLYDRLKARYGKDFDESGFDDAVREMRYYTQARHSAFSDYAKRLQREKSQKMRDNTQKLRKKRYEPERWPVPARKILKNS